MRKKLINLHYEWMEKGDLPDDGLCNCLEGTKYSETLSNFSPTDEDERSLSMEGCSVVYWAAGRMEEGQCRYYSYTQLRQDIVLFICAIHGEL